MNKLLKLCFIQENLRLCWKRFRHSPFDLLLGFFNVFYRALTSNELYTHQPLNYRQMKHQPGFRHLNAVKMTLLKFKLSINIGKKWLFDCSTMVILFLFSRTILTKTRCFCPHYFSLPFFKNHFL